LVAAAKFLVTATKILFVVPNFVAVTKPFFFPWRSLELIDSLGQKRVCEFPVDERFLQGLRVSIFFQFSLSAVFSGLRFDGRGQVWRRWITVTCAVGEIAFATINEQTFSS